MSKFWCSFGRPCAHNTQLSVHQPTTVAAQPIRTPLLSTQLSHTIDTASTRGGEGGHAQPIRTPLLSTQLSHTTDTVDTRDWEGGHAQPIRTSLLSAQLSHTTAHGAGKEDSLGQSERHFCQHRYGTQVTSLTHLVRRGNTDRVNGSRQEGAQLE